MAYVKIPIHYNVNPESRLEILKKFISDEGEHKKIAEHLQLLARGEITGKPIKERRQVKLIDMLIIFFKNSHKPTSKLTKDDLRKFKDDFLADKIVKEDGNPYSDETKEDCTECVTRYLECTYPKKIGAWASPTMPFRKWFVIRAKKKTPEFLAESEVEKLYNASKTIEGKYLIAVMFDAGCRIEEFLNLRFEDIDSPTSNFPYYRFDFKEEYSKTKGRKIGMYWKYSTEAISKYLAICENKEPKAQIFPKEYDAVRKFLYRLGKKALNKRVHPHLLRKSSTTHYADKLNRQQLCIRYGWAFSSEMPDTYISRKGLDEEEVKKVALNDDISVLRKENRELQTKQEIALKEIEGLSSKTEKQEKLIKKMTDAISKSNKESQEVNPAIIKEVEEMRKTIIELQKTVQTLKAK